MNKTLESIYAHAPIPLQNLMVSGYGYRLHRMRYGATWNSLLKELEKSQWLSLPQLKNLQMGKLSHLLDHAYQNVPYYRRIFDQHGIHPRDISSLSDICKIPILRKTTLRDYPEELVAINLDRQNLIRDHTSGTTGSSTILYNDPDTHQKHWAFVERFRHWAGVKVGDKRASFGVRMVVPYKQTKPPFWRFNRCENQLFFSIFHLSPNNLKAYTEALRRFDPVFIDSYPSAIYTISRFILDNKLESAHPKAIITTAETLFDHQRKAIEQAFGCKVYDWYGSSEFAAFACECPEGGLHLNSEFGLLEILKEDESPAPPGEWGKLIVTGFSNMAQPLIRFEIGDMGILADQECICGRKLPVLEKITGRIEDVVVTPDGRLIARFDPIFKDSRHIIEAQIIQDTLNELRVKLVTSNGYSAADTVELLKQFGLRCGAQMRIQLEFVKQIPRSQSGKFRAVISNVPSPYKYQVPSEMRE